MCPRVCIRQASVVRWWSLPKVGVGILGPGSRCSSTGLLRGPLSDFPALAVHFIPAPQPVMISASCLDWLLGQLSSGRQSAASVHIVANSLYMYLVPGTRYLHLVSRILVLVSRIQVSFPGSWSLYPGSRSRFQDPGLISRIQVWLPGSMGGGEYRNSAHAAEI